MLENLPRVSVLLSTYNPENFLEKQIQSIKDQISVNIELFVRDDASASYEYLDKINEYIIPTNLEKGKQNLGPAKSFMRLLEFEKGNDFVAFADQDDIWHPEKIRSAVDAIGFTDIPTLYYSNVYLFEEHDANNVKKSDFNFVQLPRSFFENSAMGCTIVMNAAAVSTIKKYSNRNAVMHDWFCALIIHLNGNIIFDPVPKMLYRIHPNQSVGYRKNRSIRSLRNLDYLRTTMSQTEEIVEQSKYSKNYEMVPNLYRNTKHYKNKLFKIRIICSRQKLRTSFFADLSVRLRLVAISFF